MTQRPRYPRSTCCVIGCRRTSTLFEREWICGEHWRLVDRDVKRLRTKILKRRRHEVEAAQGRFNAACEALAVNKPDESRYRLEDLEAYDLAQAQLSGVNRGYWATVDLFWRRMKRQATERALGISA
jgi:hypothetical protein